MPSDERRRANQPTRFAAFGKDPALEEECQRKAAPEKCQLRRESRKFLDELRTEAKVGYSIIDRGKNSIDLANTKSTKSVLTKTRQLTSHRHHPLVENR